MKRTSALIADDEPLLRERLRSHLATLWPGLQLLDDARNGPEAIELFELHQPQIVFLDIHMPCRLLSKAPSITWSSLSIPRAWPIRCSACNARSPAPSKPTHRWPPCWSSLQGDWRPSHVHGCSGSRPQWAIACG